MRIRQSALLITCEHGGNKIPKKYQPQFRSREAKALLETHRGWDPGALLVAKDVAKLTGAEIFSAEVSRLLVDLNRSENHTNAFSEFSSPLSAAEREKILEAYHRPYRREVSTWLANKTRAKQVLHFSIHSFTPVLHGITRSCDLGILYDPKRPLERKVAGLLKEEFRMRFPELRTRMNYPYKGYSNGFTTQLRKELAPEAYSGIEIELNQRLASELKSSSSRIQFSKSLAQALQTVLE